MDELVSAWVGDGTTPFQLGLLAVFEAGPFLGPDGVADVERVRREFARRAGGVRVLTRRVVWTRLGEGRPFWAADPAFDPAGHVGACTLPPGTPVADWAAVHVVRPLDLARPLWRAEVAGGLPGGRFAVLVVLHHLCVDGRAGVAVLGALLDPRPDAGARPAPARAVAALPTHPEIVRERLGELLAALRARAPRPEKRVPRRATWGTMRAAMADFGDPVNIACLPRVIRPGRRLAVVHRPLQAVRDDGHRLGVTVNDLLLAAVTGGVRELLLRHGECADGMVLRATVPAATDRPGQVTGMFVADLPVGEADPLRRLASIARTSGLRKRRLREADSDLTGVLGLPVPLLRPFLQHSRRWGSRRIMLSVADVVGPPEPLWLAGARLEKAVPIPPLSPLVPLSVAALSYAGDLAVCVAATRAVEDLDVIARGMNRAFTDLSAAAPQRRTDAASPGMPQLAPVRPVDVSDVRLWRPRPRRSQGHGADVDVVPDSAR